MNIQQQKVANRIRRHKKIRRVVSGVKDKPRLVLYKSNRMITAQMIDDSAGVTLAAVRTEGSNATVASANNAGKEIAARAKKLGITAVVFDRGGFLYAGKIKAFAEGAREAGLQF